MSTDPSDRTNDARTVLLCAGTDTGVAAGIARRAGLLLAARRAVVLSIWHPARLHGPAGALLDTWYDLERTLDAEAEAQARASAGAAREVLVSMGWQATVDVVRDERRVWEVAREHAAATHAAVIVAGTHDRRDGRPGGLGSEVRGLAHHGGHPLLVVPPWELPADHDPAVFAYDGSDGAVAALVAATELLLERPAVVATAWRSVRAASQAALAVLPAAVVAGGSERLDDARRGWARETAEDGVLRLEAAGWTAHAEGALVEAGEWQAIARCADDAQAALIVCGSRRGSAAAALLLGSVAEALVRHSGRPVLLVPVRANY